MTLGGSFRPGMERFHGSLSVLGWNDSMGVIMFWDGTTPDVSFCPVMERLQKGSFCPGMERLQGSHSVLGWNDSRKSFCPEMEILHGSHSVLG